MSSAISVQTLEGNGLLALLCPEAQQQMLPTLNHINLKVGVPLYEHDGRIAPLYFPLTAVTSLFSEMGATIGREGMVGLPVFWGDKMMSLSTKTQMSGTALWMGQEDFLSLVDDEKCGLRATLLRYTQALFSQLAPQSACNQSHNMEERCARWILMTQDRVGKDEFPLTQEFLAYMLGSRRASVTIAAGILASADLITYTRGNIRVLDRTRLEEASCECYGVIKREYERLIGKMSG